MSAPPTHPVFTRCALVRHAQTLRLLAQQAFERPEPEQQAYDQVFQTALPILQR